MALAALEKLEEGKEGKRGEKNMYIYIYINSIYKLYIYSIM